MGWRSHEFWSRYRLFGSIIHWGTFASLEGFRTTDKSDQRGKGFDAKSVIPFLSLGDKAYYITQVEAAVGLGGTIRLGINPGELVDFLLGWMTIDFYGDDVQPQSREVNRRFGPPLFLDLPDALESSPNQHHHRKREKPNDNADPSKSITTPCSISE
jgi:hypothetical protein